jgi:hypothetical protein
MGPAARAVRITRAARGEHNGVLGAAAVAFERLTGDPALRAAAPTHAPTTAEPHA